MYPSRRVRVIEFVSELSYQSYGASCAGRAGRPGPGSIVAASLAWQDGGCILGHVVRPGHVAESSHVPRDPGANRPESPDPKMAGLIRRWRADYRKNIHSGKSPEPISSRRRDAAATTTAVPCLHRIVRPRSHV